MEKKPLPIGIDNFEMLITRGYYYIDKTLLIKDLLDNKASVNLFTRPRRFGKTLNMSMLQYYFEDRRNEFDGSKKDNTYLFDGLNIMNQEDKYLSYMGKYPVINLSLKSGKQPTFKMANESIIDEIIKEYTRHRYILKEDKLSDGEKQAYLNILNRTARDIDYAKSLELLSRCLEKHFNKKVIILIDEYDVPLENSFFEGFYDEMIKFIRSLFESSLKTNTALEFAVITGCLRISKESIFTGLNNLEIISILNKSYDEYFGFTNQEVEKICEDYSIANKYEVIKEWYNGYTFGEANVYNPWSVVRFVKDVVINPKVFPTSYWANTSSNSIVKSLIERSDDKTKGEIEALIEGKTIEKPINEDITYDEVYDTMDNLWNFMFFTGYFKKISERMDEEENRFVELAIPNKEVKYIFRTKILKWFDEKIKAENLSTLYTAIIKGDVELLQKEINRLLRKTISFNDAYENFYHGFIVGILSHMDGYIVKSNRESGDGRSDIFIRPVSIFDRAVIIEIKVCDKPREIFAKCDEALNQIEEKRYADDLREEGFDDIIKYGFSFYRKDCVVKMS
ncbi:MAG: AAA family ATPase [Romboutsia sp.]